MPVGDGNNYRAKCHIGPGDEGEPIVTINEARGELTRGTTHREELMRLIEDYTQVGPPSWKPLDRRAVEVLVGSPV